MARINTHAYPELHKLLWDMHCRYLDPVDALRIYEQRWAFVDQGALTVREQRLINRLVRQAGGVFMPAGG